MKSLKIVVLLLCVCVAPALAANVELVESFPLETALGVPGVRQTQAVWLEMFRGAQTQIDIEQFYVSDQAGEALVPVLTAIKDAAARGVKVRLLVDSKFFKTYPDSVNELGRLTNVQTRTIDFSETGGVQHAKFFTVDGQQSFVGSQNFDWRALSHIHEIGLRVADARIAADLETIFEKDWAMAGGEPLKSRSGPKPKSLKSEDSDLTVVASPEVANPEGIAYSATAITDLLKSARTSVRIQNMEYTTRGSNAKAPAWTVLDSAIREAAARGVHVSLLLDVSDIKKAKKDLVALAALKNVELKIVTIPAWSGGAISYARLIHSKYLVVDDVAVWIGSENWSQSYFTNTRNVGLVVRLPEVTANLAQVFDRLWQSAYARSL